MLYSKPNFYKRQPPQFPQHFFLRGVTSQTGLQQNSISTSLPPPPYNDTVLYFKTIFDKSQPPQYPRHLGGGAILQTGPPQNFTPPPPYNDVVLYSKTNFNKSQPRVGTFGDPPDLTQTQLTH